MAISPIILCNRPGPLEAYLKGASFPLRYLSLEEGRDSGLIRDYLRGRPQVEELSRSDLLRERSTAFRKKYIHFMGKLNTANRSMWWWAMPFTSKNPLATSLCRNTAFFLTIAVVAQRDSRPLLVITDSPDLAGQVAAWAEKEGIGVVNLIRSRVYWRRFLKRYTPAGVIRAAIRTLALWSLSRYYKPARNLEEHHIVFATVTHPRCFVSPDGYEDAYFGNLLEKSVESDGKPLGLALLMERPFQQLKKLKNLEYPVPIWPMERCLTLPSLVACTLRSLRSALGPLKVSGDMEIDGYDLSHLVKGTVNEGRRSGEFFLNLRVYYCAKWLSRKIRVDRCVYPYENRSWEKMLLLGMGHGSPDTHLVGYQHASLTPSHTNFMFDPDEAEVTPLPHRILTTGDVITTWLGDEGNYPPGMFQTACALRQEQLNTIQSRRSGPAIQILVALASSIQEYVETISFLETALADDSGFEVRIRPHPEFPLESALAIRPLTGPKFYFESTGSLADDLEWADVVLYASSTVGLEAVSMGIPAVYLDLGNFLDTDPMNGWGEFRWQVKEPSDLAVTLQHIKNIPEEEFQTLQKRGRDYAQNYLKPVTDEGLADFWEG